MGEHCDNDVGPVFMGCDLFELYDLYMGEHCDNDVIIGIIQ